ncbi:MAG: hypothetical protein ACJARZ_001576 [Dokdonia sp.]|jgi:hypothetical protein
MERSLLSKQNIREMDIEKPKVPRPILAKLQEHFDLLIPRNLFLVSPNTYPKKVYHTAGSTSVKENITIAFRIVFHEERHICEYFLNADGYTEHRRYVVEIDEVEMLPNFEGQFGHSEFEDESIDYTEHMRIVKHNTEIRKLLKKKGFLKK